MPAEPDHRERVRDPLKGYGRTRAQNAGIRVAAQPSPLYQLLALATLLSARISARNIAPRHTYANRRERRGHP